VSSAPAHAPRLGGTARRTAPGREWRRSDVVGEVTRYLGAVSILVVGAIHAEQYYEDYFYVVPTIGTLFLLSFVGAAIVGAVLLAPARLLGRRIGDLILAVAALGAIGIALGTLMSLLISEYMPLFGFMESGWRLAIILTLVFDGLTTAFLGLFLTLIGLRFLRIRRGAGHD
jgi:hypothetical protein